MQILLLNSYKNNNIYINYANNTENYANIIEKLCKHNIKLCYLQGERAVM